MDVFARTLPLIKINKTRHTDSNNNNNNNAL